MGARRFIQQYKRTIIAVILLFVLPLIPIYWRGHVLLREYERERPVEGGNPPGCSRAGHNDPRQRRTRRLRPFRRNTCYFAAGGHRR